MLSQREVTTHYTTDEYASSDIYEDYPGAITLCGLTISKARNDAARFVHHRLVHDTWPALSQLDSVSIFHTDRSRVDCDICSLLLFAKDAE